MLFNYCLHVHWVRFVVAKDGKDGHVEPRSQLGHGVDEEVGVALLRGRPHAVVDDVARENHVRNVL